MDRMTARRAGAIILASALAAATAYGAFGIGQAARAAADGARAGAAVEAPPPPPPPPLPTPHANNAVAAIASGDGYRLYSFNGLRGGKTYRDTSREAWVYDSRERAWRRLPDLPARGGRLASVAAALDGAVYIFGGYTVAEDHAEASTPEVFRFDPQSESYSRLADMPVPVDDSVAFAYQDRYVYLVSGWHDAANVNLVQVYDVREDRWFRATDYPGPAVFGHAGGAVGGAFVIADGVTATRDENGRGRFVETAAAWLGEIDPADPARIDWRELPPHPGGPLYRMAATGDAARNQILFAGGADNPYNYNGVGYDGAPAKPSALIFAFDLATEEWVALGRRAKAVMDHRGLLQVEGAYLTIGGIDAALKVIGDVVVTRIDD